MELVIPYTLSTIFVTGFMAVLGFVLFLNIFSLPANWIMLALIALWKYIYPDTASMTATFFIILTVLAIVGEVLEFGLQVAKAKKYGSSSSGTFAGIVGAIIGAIVLAPLFFGIGALIGAVLGAWIGCYIMEVAKGRPQKEAVDAAFGAMVGRFLGTVVKCGIGGIMLAVTGRYIWPEEPVQEEIVFLLKNTVFA